MINVPFYLLSNINSRFLFPSLPLPGSDALQWARRPAQATGAGSRRRALSHPICSAEGKLLQRVPVRALQPYSHALHRQPGGQRKGQLFDLTLFVIRTL